MTEYISYDLDGNEIYQVFDQGTSTNAHASVNVDNNAVQIDAHNDDGHLVIRASSATDDKFISCIDTVDNVEKASLSTTGALVVRQLEAGNTVLASTFATALQSQSLGVSGESHLVGASTFGDVETPTMQINNQGIQIDKELVLNDATLSTGGIALLDDAVLGFKPYDQNGLPIDGSQFTFGRHAQIGDLSHDNDGICLRQIANVDGVQEAHTVLISPNPTDPNLVIHSNKNADFLKFIRCPDDADRITDNDTKFRVNANGYIFSDQMDILFHRLSILDQLVDHLMNDPIPAETNDLGTHTTENSIS